MTDLKNLQEDRSFLTSENILPPHVPTQIAPDNLLQQIQKDSHSYVMRTYEEVLETLIQKVGQPFFAKNGFILYQGDSLELLDRMFEANFRVALTITSPPYNIGKEYETSMERENYISWCSKWMEKVFAITKKNGAFWLNLGYFEIQNRGLCVPIPYLLWDKSPFYLLQEVVWNYGAGVTTKKRFCPRNEKWLFYIKNPDNYTFNLDDVRDPNVKYPNQKKNGKLRCNPLGKNPSDVWQIPKVTTGHKRSSKERTEHPAQFPLALIDRIVKISSNIGEVVIDPFSGSASTGIAAIGNGRVYIGIEICENYCEIALNRFLQYEDEKKERSRQQNLF